jgi:2-alkenal reductase
MPLCPSVVTVKAVRGDGALVQGSGFLYCCKGNVVTSLHVVANASAITVVFADETQSNATLIGGDIYTDIAVVRCGVLPASAKPMPLGNSSALKVGERVYAVGSPYGLSTSLSIGTVSGVGRVVWLADLGFSYPQAAYAVADVVQFDVNVAPGSSGCPLLNGKCEVVGVIFAMREHGIAFAVSSDIARRVIAGIITNGRYDHPWLGVGYQPDYVGGMKVLYVFPGSPADRTGLREGDVITAVDGHQVRTAGDFMTFMEKFRSPGDIVTLAVQRSGLQHQMQLQLAARP